MQKRILVVIDDEATSAVAVSKGIEMAQALNAEILFYYVPPRFDLIVGDEMTRLSNVPEEDFHRDVAVNAANKMAEASKLAELNGVHSHKILGVCDDAGKRVAEMAQSRNCQMIVVSTEKKNAVMRLISGNIVPRLISVASVPVLVCTPATDAVEPVAGTPSRRRGLRKTRVLPQME